MKITVPWPTITRFCPSREIILVPVKETVADRVDSPGVLLEGTLERICWLPKN